MTETKSPFSARDEAEFAADLAARGTRAFADMIRRQAEKPENAAIREKMIEIAGQMER